ANDCEDPNDPTTRKFICTPDADTPAAQPRCLYPCRDDSDCRSGRACLKEDRGRFRKGRFSMFASDEGVCADAKVIEHRSCVPQYVTYQVNAARSFVVSGSATGVLTPGGYEHSGACKEAA